MWRGLRQAILFTQKRVMTAPVRPSQKDVGEWMAALDGTGSPPGLGATPWSGASPSSRAQWQSLQEQEGTLGRATYERHKFRAGIGSVAMRWGIPGFWGIL